MLHVRWATDLHNTPEFLEENGVVIDQRELKKRTLGAIENFTIRAMHDQPDFTINTGDNIDTGRERDGDYALQGEVLERLNHLNGNLYSLPGNHDVRHGKKINLHADFNFLNHGKIIPTPNATVVLWYADVTPHSEGSKKYYQATSQNLTWLKSALGSTPPHRPVLLFTHIPLDSEGFINPLDEDEAANPERGCYRNGHHIRKILLNAQRNIFVFSGHRHVNARPFYIRNVRFMTMDRLLRPFTKGEGREEGVNYADIWVGKRRLMLTRYGGTPFKIDYTF